MYTPFYTFLLLLLVSLLNSTTYAQIQVGMDIFGEATGDQSGHSVSMPDANTVAIGARFNDEPAAENGHVRIYSWNGNSWQQKGLDIDGEATFDNSGTSVSMPDANTVAIGAPRNDGNGPNGGHVRIYNWNGNSWQQKGLDIDGIGQSGESVSMPDANTVAIGASYYSNPNGTNLGQVRIYRWNGNSWQQKGADLNGEAAYDRSGCSVSMPDSNTVAIGALGNNGNGSMAGHVRIYSWNGSSWQQKGIDIDGEAADDRSGCSVSMPDAKTVAIGAYKNDGNGTDAGHVRIYSWNGSSWQQKGIDIDGEATLDFSGISVSMPDSNNVAIGAYNNDSNTQYSGVGHVRIYSWNGSAWQQRGIDIDGQINSELSGWSVSMPDSSMVSIGSRAASGNGLTACGLVRVYSVCSNSAISNEVQSSCSSYTWGVNSQTYTTSGLYTATFTNAAGCDSIITLDLTINTPTAATDVQTACDSYTWIDGQTYTASNNSATVTLTNAAGCDSVITLDLTITNSTAATDVQSACDSYTWIDGQTYTANNNSATVTLTNAAGCDSVVTLNLTINTVSDNTVSQTGATLTANNGNATYQWIDCDNGNAAISGATAQVYTATANGNYAVVLTENGCTDTSACVNVVLSSTQFIGNEPVQVYPNPTTTNINIDFNSPHTDIQLRIYDPIGQLVLDKRYTQRDLIQVVLPQVSGLYLLELQTEKGSAAFRVVKE